MINCVEVKNINELAQLAFEIWHEYWVEILSIEQIDYMVENFQSESAIRNQIENENYAYFFIKTKVKHDGDNGGVGGRDGEGFAVWRDRWRRGTHDGRRKLF